MQPSGQSIGPLHSVVLEGWKEAVRLARQLPSTERAAFCRLISARAEGLASLEATMPGDITLAQETQTFVHGLSSDKMTARPKIVAAISAVASILGLNIVTAALDIGEGAGTTLVALVAAGGTAVVFIAVRAGQGAVQAVQQAAQERQERAKPVNETLARIASTERQLFSAFSQPVPNPALTVTDIKNYILAGAAGGLLIVGFFSVFL